MRKGSTATRATLQVDERLPVIDWSSEQPMLRVEDVCAILGLSRKTVYRNLAALGARRIGPRTLRFSAPQITDLARRRDAEKWRRNNALSQDQRRAKAAREFIWKERGGGRLLVEPRLEAIVAPLAQPFDDFLFVEQ